MSFACLYNKSTPVLSVTYDESLFVESRIILFFKVLNLLHIWLKLISSQISEGLLFGNCTFITRNPLLATLSLACTTQHCITFTTIGYVLNVRHMHVTLLAL